MYCRLRKEVKKLVRQKKLILWKKVVEKVNLNCERTRKEFWALVGRTKKAKNRGIASLKGVEGVSITSTKGKLEVLQKHYQHMGRVSIDSDFDEIGKVEWKLVVGCQGHVRISS